MAEEVVAQILSRLPPKSLMRFKCVGKSWCALVNNPGFISQHLHLYNKFASTPILIKRSLINRPESIIEEVVFSLLHLHSDDDNCIANCRSFVDDISFPASMGLKTRGQYIELPMYRPRSVDQAIYVVGQCDGIICLLVLYTRTKLILCNPAIKEFRIVEDEDVISFHVGFGYDPKSKDYILINVMPNGRILFDSDRLIIHPPRAKLYTLGTGSWREINTNYLETETTTFWPTLFQLYYEGIFYWFGNEQRKDLLSEYDQDDEDNSRLVIIFYDTGDEIFHTLLGPDGFYDPNEGLYTMRLAVLNQSIALYGFHCIGNCPEPFEIWIMVDFDGTTCSWTKQLAVVPPILELYMPGALWKNSVVLMTREGRVLSFDFVKEEITYHPIHGVLRADFQAENDMVDEVNKRNDAFKEQHPDATEEQIMESVQSQQIEVLGTVLKTRKGKEIRGMRRGCERDLSHSSNDSTSHSHPPRVDEQQLQEVHERYEQRLKESEERAQQQIQEVKQRALRAESMYSDVQSQIVAIYEHLGMPPPPPPQFPPPPSPQSSPPPQVSPHNNDDRGDNIGLDENDNWYY